MILTISFINSSSAALWSRDWELVGGAIAILTMAWSAWQYRHVRQLRDRLDRVMSENCSLQQDVVERREIEHQLQTSQQLLQLVMDNIPQAIFWKDRQSTYLGSNRIFARTGGFEDPAELIGKTDFDLPWTLAEAEWYRHCDRQVMDTDAPQYRIVETQMQADGRQVWLETNKVPLHDANGGVVGILGTFEDITERKEAELALQKAEEKYRQIFDRAIEGIFQSTPDGRYVSANPSLARICGYDTPAGLMAAIDNIGTQLYVNPERRTEFVQAIAACGSVTDFESQVYRGEDKIWVSESVRGVCDESGTLLYYEGTVIDISERKQAEATLERTLSLLRATLESTADGIVVISPDERIVSWNQRYVDLFEIPSSLLHAGASDRELVAHIQQQVRDPEAFTLDAVASYQQLDTVRVTTLELCNGTTVERHSHPQKIGDAIVGAVVSYRDVTHLKQAQIALQQQVSRAQLVGDITRDIRQSLDSDRIFQTTATALARALGVNRCLIHAYESDPHPSIPIVAEYLEAGYPSIRTFIDGDIPVEGNPHALAVLAEDRAVGVDNVYADPRLAPVQELCVALNLHSMLCARTSQQEHPNGLICLQQCDRQRHWTAADIELLEAVASQMGIALEQARLLERERHLLDAQVAKNRDLARAKQQADAANEAKGQFLAMMSHEIRTPLNAVLGMAELLQLTSLDDRQRQSLDTICTSGDTLLTLIDDLLDFSKFESEPFELECSPFSPRACVESTIELLDPQATAKGLSLDVAIADRVPEIIGGDSTRLRQILTNLIGNAIKFTETGRIVVSLTAGRSRESAQPDATETTMLRFAVRDTGIGIPADRLDAVFAAFQQVDNSMSRRYGGTGLGLAICQRLCALMGGHIRVRSRVGRGSVFYFDIPASAVAVTPTRPKQTQGPTVIAPSSNGSSSEAQSQRILVVEDVPTNQLVARQMLHHLGCDIELANNGREALEKLRQYPYELVLMDVQMPEMDGIEATRRIRQWGEEICQPRIVAMTAHAAQRDRELCLQAGMDDYITKPLRLQVLAAALHAPTALPITVPRRSNLSSYPSLSEHSSLPERSNGTQASLNLQVLAGLRQIAADDFPTLVREVADSALDEVPHRLQAIRQAASSNQSYDLFRAAHSLRSLSASIGAVGLAQACAALERPSQSSDRDQLIAAIEGEWECVRPLLETNLADWLP